MLVLHDHPDCANAFEVRFLPGEPGRAYRVVRNPLGSQGGRPAFAAANR